MGAKESIKDRAFGRQPKEDNVVQIQPGEVRPLVRVRVRASMVPVDKQWVEVHPQIRPREDGPWWNLSHKPILLARRYSGSDGTRELQELYATSVLRHLLTAHGATLWSLQGKEERDQDVVHQYSYWAPLGARLSVAMTHQLDGTVAVVGLS